MCMYVEVLLVNLFEVNPQLNSTSLVLPLGHVTNKLKLPLLEYVLKYVQSGVLT